MPSIGFAGGPYAPHPAAILLAPGESVRAAFSAPSWLHGSARNPSGDALALESGQNLQSQREEVGCSDGVSVLDHPPAMAALHCCTPTAQQGCGKKRQVLSLLRMCTDTEDI